MNRLAALVIVDCQNDFIDPKGALYIPGAERIKDALVNTIKQQDRYFDWIILTQDWHSKEDYAQREESKMFPEHCIKGTWGAQIIDEVELALQDPSIDAVELRYTKPVFDIWAESPDFISAVKRNLEPQDTIYVCGVATNYCVYQAIKGFIEAGFEDVVLLTGAVKGIPDGTYEPRMVELKKMGVKFVENIEDGEV